MPITEFCRLLVTIIEFCRLLVTIIGNSVCCSIAISATYKSTMKAAHFSLFIFLLSFTEQTTAQRDACPSWSIPVNSSSTTCYCNNYLTGVKCFPILHVGNCMTYNSSTAIVEFGHCPFVTYNPNTAIIEDRNFYILPDNVSLLNEFMCGPLN